MKNDAGDEMHVEPDPLMKDRMQVTGPDGKRFAVDKSFDGRWRGSSEAGEWNVGPSLLGTNDFDGTGPSGAVTFERSFGPLTSAGMPGAPSTAQQRAGWRVNRTTTKESKAPRRMRASDFSVGKFWRAKRMHWADRIMLTLWLIGSAAWLAVTVGAAVGLHVFVTGGSWRDGDYDSLDLGPIFDMSTSGVRVWLTVGLVVAFLLSMLTFEPFEYNDPYEMGFDVGVAGVVAAVAVALFASIVTEQLPPNEVRLWMIYAGVAVGFARLLQWAPIERTRRALWRRWGRTTLR